MNTSETAEQPTQPSNKTDIAKLSLPELKQKLGYSPDGLTEDEAHSRLDQYGPNELQESHTNPILKFLSYVWGPIPWMIEAAAILSVIVNHWMTGRGHLN